MIEQRRQRHDGEDGKDEERRPRFALEHLANAHHGNEHQQPERRIATSFIEEVARMWLRLDDTGFVRFVNSVG